MARHADNLLPLKCSDKTDRKKIQAYKVNRLILRTVESWPTKVLVGSQAHACVCL